MTENQITDLLVKGVLRHSSAPVIERFATEVCGVREPLGEVRVLETQQRQRALPGTSRALVVGLAPAPALDHSSTNIGGDAVIDAVVAGSTALLIENKIKGPLAWDQLVRHALHWSLPIDRAEPMWTVAEVPPGYTLTTWDTLGGWLARERRRGGGAASELTRLADEVESRGLTTLDPDAPPAAPARALDLEPMPEPVDPRALSAIWDYRAVREGCTALFAHAPVDAGDCRDDTRRMREAFEAAGLSVPCGLRYTHRDGAMTPLRVLDTLYRGGGRLKDAYPAEWTATRMRLTDHGADQTVLVAMLAWAGATSRKAASDNIFRNIPVIWDLTPERNPGLESLHAVVDAARKMSR